MHFCNNHKAPCNIFIDSKEMCSEQLFNKFLDVFKYVFDVFEYLTSESGKGKVTHMEVSWRSPTFKLCLG